MEFRAIQGSVLGISQGRLFVRQRDGSDFPIALGGARPEAIPGQRITVILAALHDDANYRIVSIANRSTRRSFTFGDNLAGLAVPLEIRLFSALTVFSILPAIFIYFFTTLGRPAFEVVPKSNHLFFIIFVAVWCGTLFWLNALANRAKSQARQDLASFQQGLRDS